jgi:complex iron-sulfur molybdoenzyme family reductase subunit gamma
MRTLLLMALTLLSTAAWAQAPHIIDAQFAAKLPMAAETGAWTKATALETTLYRQRTVRLRDRDVNKRLDEVLGPRTAQIKALYNKQALAVQITWADASVEQLEHAHYDAFGDAVAIEFPQRFGTGESLPYIGMGDITHPVIVAIKRAHKDGEHARQFVAAGFGSLTRIEGGTEMSMAYDAEAKRWSAVFRRPLKDNNLDLAKGLVPMGLAIWDGGEAERGGNKTVGPWRFIRLGNYPLDEAYLKYVSWGEDGTPIGDAAKGATIANTQCIACHRFAEQKAAPDGIAPGLHNIGGYAVARYIEESVTNPSAVVLRALNPNRHYDASKKDALGAHPNNAAYTWSVKDADGKPMSKMPPFAHLSPEDLGNLVAYLKTLKRGTQP